MSKKEVEFSVIIDAGQDADKNEVSQFIGEQFLKRYKHDLNLDLDPINMKGYICMKFKTGKDMNNVINMNGLPFNGVPLIIAQYNFEKYKDLHRDIMKYLGSHRIENSFDLSNLKKSFPSINPNYYVDLQIFLFYLGTQVRRQNIACDILNLSNNNIQNSKVLSRLHSFLPDLRKLILSGNPIRDTEELTSVVKGVDIEFNKITLGKSYETDENGYPDVTKPIETPHYDEPPRNLPAPTNNTQIPGQLRALLDKFYDISQTDLRSISQFYHPESSFSFVFRKCSMQESLGPLKSFNQNLNYKKPEESVTQGNQNIANTLAEIFQNGFQGKVSSESIKLIDGIFYNANILGRVQLGNDNYTFYRNLTIYGINNDFLIANDVLYLT